jgi:hypothetical protein
MSASKAKLGGPGGSSYKYYAGYDPSGRASCKQCGEKIKKGSLRVSRVAPNVVKHEKFAKGKEHVIDILHHYHASHAFPAFSRSRCTSRVPLKPHHLAGFDLLKKEDKKKMEARVEAFAEKWHKKCVSRR